MGFWRWLPPRRWCQAESEYKNKNNKRFRRLVNVFKPTRGILSDVTVG